MRRLTTVVAATAAATMALGVSACSAPDDGPVTLTWWATQQTASIADSEAAYEESIARFAEATGIEVEVEVIPWADLYNRILTAISSGTGPDVLNIGTTWTGSLHETGALSPIEGDALDWLGGTDRFVPSVYESAQVPGEVQDAVPWLSNVYSLYYNTALFEAAGIDEPPATFEEFVDVAQQLTIDTDGDGENDQWGFTTAAADVQVNSHMAFIFGSQFGGSFVDDEGNATLDSPEQIEGVQAFVNLMAEDGVVAPANAETNQGIVVLDQFVNGEAAMMFAQNPDEQFASRGFSDWAVAPTPVREGGDNVQSMVAGTNLTVLTDSPNQEEAFQFVEHLTSVDEQGTMAAAFSMLPVVTDAYDAPALADDPTISVRQETQANAVAPFPLVGNIGEIEAAVGGALVAAFQAYATGGDPDVPGRLAAANAEVN